MTRPPRLAFCITCNARERAIIAGRCIVCGNHPDTTPPSCRDPLTYTCSYGTITTATPPPQPKEQQ